MRRDVEAAIHRCDRASPFPVAWALLLRARHDDRPDEPMTHDASAPPNDRELAATVRHFGRARVLIVGDVILDRYRIGDAHRLSPEAPIPVLRPSRRHDTPGGAANVAMNVVSLGGQAVLAGVIGDDDAGADRRPAGREKSRTEAR